MFALSYTTDVNPPGATPVLTRSQVWQGLVMKAEDARPFVPGMEKCEVVEHFDGGLVRDVSFKGDAVRERITFTPDIQVHFDQFERGSWITNVISESERGLLLTFTFAVMFPGVQPGSTAERERGESMRGAYVAAVAATLDRVRAMSRDGRLAA